MLRRSRLLLSPCHGQTPDILNVRETNVEGPGLHVDRREPTPPKDNVIKISDFLNLKSLIFNRQRGSRASGITFPGRAWE